MLRACSGKPEERGEGAVILVVANDDGTYTEDNPERAVLWVRDRYTSPAGPPARGFGLGCVNCKREIRDSEFYICVDLGDTAHVWCVKVEGGNPGGSLEGWP